MNKFIRRDYPQSVYDVLVRDGVLPTMARIYAARKVESARHLETALEHLIPPASLKNADEMARILVDGIAAGKRFLVVADYDADGATACAVCIRALRAFGGNVGYLVPNRFEYGYGLTPEIVSLAYEQKPDFLITVDNGIASIDGVREAKRLGMATLITDHHLAADELPEGECIVNPNQPGCEFPSKHLAGVGVAFYVMLQLRSELRARGVLTAESQPNLSKLLDLVALGTVADVVRLDHNNRILVAGGLKRIRAGRACAGIRALFQVSARDPAKAASYDLAFCLGPRLNAAGRLTDMSLGIECLLTDDEERALTLASELDRLNRERREIEAEMHEQALLALEEVRADDGFGLCVFDPRWHQGVIGILASRLREKFNRPVIAFASGGNGELKGSGRSIAALHLRDALDLISKRYPKLVLKFGGHSAAAGLTISHGDFDRFARAFEAALRSLLGPADLERVIETDGSLSRDELNNNLALAIGSEVWGQGFPAPLFRDGFEVESQSVVADKHSKLKLRKDGRAFHAMLFSYSGPLPSMIQAAYRVETGEYGLRLIIDSWSDGSLS
ncbi:MAG: single-stranded-DNA-specific exonuclease RecJ [Burkholderiales bacterium]